MKAACGFDSLADDSTSLIAEENLMIPGVSKKYPLLTGNRNDTIRYYYSRSE